MCVIYGLWRSLLNSALQRPAQNHPSRRGHCKRKQGRAGGTGVGSWRPVPVMESTEHSTEEELGVQDLHFTQNNPKSKQTFHIRKHPIYPLFPVPNDLLLLSTQFLQSNLRATTYCLGSCCAYAKLKWQIRVHLGPSNYAPSDKTFYISADNTVVRSHACYWRETKCLLYLIFIYLHFKSRMWLVATMLDSAGWSRGNGCQ